VRESAEARVYGKVFNLKKLKKQKPWLLIGVTGCMPGRDKDGKIKKRLKDIDLFFSTKDMTQLPARLMELNPDLRPMEDVEEDYLRLRPNYQKDFQAFVTIQTGCNQYCSYCVVPYARGLEINRPVKDILEEINNLASNGCLEISLLGQVVNHYKAPDPENFSKSNSYKKNDFAKLLWGINQIEGIERLDWPGPNPLYFDEELLDALILPKQVNYVHLPIQSGNDEILKKMNRQYTRDFYINLVKKIREKRPEIAISTDIIVGFCGETEEQFQDSVNLYKECSFDIAYPAKYSTRPGTLADKLYKDDVSYEEKKRRWQILQDLMEDITCEKNKVYLNKKLSVLVDSYKNGWCTGNSSEMKRVSFKGDESMIGSIREVKIFKTDTWMMWGRGS
jgi:tRNA-2-methylthio-N6-dimethylallyladenosine synthase